MATETASDLEAFHAFVGTQLAQGNRRMTPPEAVAAFDAYRRDVEKLNEALRPAFEEYQRGECGPMDWEALKVRVRDRLAREGIVEGAP